MLATASTTYVERVDRERRQHETDLYVYLLAGLSQAARHAVSAARHGLDPAQAASDAILGNDALELPGIATGMTKILEAAYDAGWRRVERTAGLQLSLTTDDAFRAGRDRMAQQARDYAASVASTISAGLRGALASTTGGVKAAVAVVRGWFRRSGYVVSEHREAVKPSKTRNAAITHAVSAYNRGSDSGFMAIPTVTGFEFVSILDDATTKYCRPLNGVKVPKDSPWVAAHKTPRHFGCRSLMRPILGTFTPTRDPPWVPPMTGFPL